MGSRRAPGGVIEEGPGELGKASEIEDQVLPRAGGRRAKLPWLPEQLEKMRPGQYVKVAQARDEEESRVLQKRVSSHLSWLRRHGRLSEEVLTSVRRLKDHSVVIIRAKPEDGRLGRPKSTAAARRRGGKKR